MPKVLVTESHLEDIADAIRGKNGSQNTYTPAQMASAITNIPSGGSSGTTVSVGFGILGPAGSMFFTDANGVGHYNEDASNYHNFDTGYMTIQNVLVGSLFVVYGVGDLAMTGWTSTTDLTLEYTLSIGSGRTAQKVFFLKVID